MPIHFGGVTLNLTFASLLKALLSDNGLFWVKQIRFLVTNKAFFRGVEDIEGAFFLSQCQQLPAFVQSQWRLMTFFPKPTFSLLLPQSPSILIGQKV